MLARLMKVRQREEALLIFHWRSLPPPGAIQKWRTLGWFARAKLIEFGLDFVANCVHVLFKFI